MPPIIEIRGVSKKYRLGQIGMTSLREDVERLGRWFGSLGRTAPVATPDVPDARDFWALRDVSFSVEPGEMIGVIGRNGAGKSTLLKILSRITEPTTGEIRLRGRVGSLLEVGTGFHPELSGRDNIFINGSILGMSRDEIARKFDEIVAFAEVDQFIDTPVKRYSSGMYVRLAFAIAAHLEPEILIVDEVLAVGDAAFQRKCIDKMESIRVNSGRTILFVSHNMEIVRRLCSRCVLLDKGRVSMVGPVEEIARAYHGATVKSHPPGAWLSLDAIPRRATSDSAHFTRIRFRPADGGNALYPQSIAEFEFEIESARATPVRSIAVTLFADNGTKLLNYDTVSKNEIVRLEAGRNRLVLRTAPLPLNPATFTVGLWLEISAQDGPTDWIEAAFHLEVAVRPSGDGWAIPYIDGLVTSDFTFACTSTAG